MTATHTTSSPSDGIRPDNKLPSIDLLRGLAIISVVFYHAMGPIYGFFIPWEGWFRSANSIEGPKVIGLHILSFGWAGVSLFFVLSGFCIHYSFLTARTHTTFSFFWRRFWRIYPAYLVALIAFTLLDGFIFAPHFNLKQFLSHAFLLHNLEQNHFFGINASFWSIAVEFQLYLLYPFVLLLREKGGMEWVLKIAFSIGFIFRLVFLWFFELPDHLITASFCSPFTTWFDWCLGAMVAEQFFAKRNAFRCRGLWVSILSVLFLLSTLWKPMTVFSFSLFSLLSAVALDYLLENPLKPRPVYLGIQFVGLVSYSLYLWHQPLIPLMRYVLDKILYPSIVWPTIGSILIGLAYASFRLLEKPGIVLGKMFWKKYF